MVIYMAVRAGSDKKIQYKDEYGFTIRDINWIWSTYQLYLYNPLTGKNSTNQKSEIIKYYINSQQNKDYILNKILIDKDNQLVNENEFKWISETNHRLIISLINIIIKKYNINQTNISTTQNYEYFINIFDCINLNKDEKIYLLNDLKSIWSNTELNENDVNWLTPLDQSQIIWAWKYLEKNNKLGYFPTSPVSIIERHQYICAFLDLISIFNGQDSKELFLYKMKKTWSQKKYRDNDRIKKPYHLPLSKDSHNKLTHLCEIFNKSQSDVLEFTINKIYNDYTKDNEGKNKFN